MGIAYDGGHGGVPQNYQKGVYWFRKAAVQGNAYAQTHLGVAYLLGHGVPQNYRKAFTWARKAAVQGYAPAQTMTGGAYFSGKGVPTNYVEAYKWFALAKVQFTRSHNPLRYSATVWKRVASRALNILTRRMPPAQIARAQSMAAAWEKAHEK